MEESTTEVDVHSPFTGEEVEVAQILIDFGSMIAKSESRCLRPLTWGAKKRLVWSATKKRSSVDSGLSAANLGTSSTSPSHSVRRTSENECETKTSTPVKTEAISPATPLSFSPSESDEKSKHCHRKSSKKRTREELLEDVKKLTENRNALRWELEKVKSHHTEVLAYNRELRAIKGQSESTMICHRRQEQQLEMKQSYDLGLSLDQSCQISAIPIAHHQQTSTGDSRAVEFSLQAREQFHHHRQDPYAQVTPPLFSSNSGLGRVNHVSPLGSIPDLNGPSEENCLMESFQVLNYSKTPADQRGRYAEARRERQMKRKIKQLRK